MDSWVYPNDVVSKEIILKETPSDFLVSESITLQSAAAVVQSRGEKRDDKYAYFKLRKRGLTTFQAISTIADHLNIDTSGVTFAGLKDEDGVTEQFIAIANTISDAELATLNDQEIGGAAFFELIPIGGGDEPIAIGGLSGNSFRIKARNLTKAAAAALERVSKHTFHFVNYYDVQRFGVPGQPKLTHLIGRNLLAENYDSARALLARSGTPEASLAANVNGDARALFAAIDPRVRSFYLCASASHDWNAALDQMIGTVCGDETWTLHREQLRWRLPRRQFHTLELLRQLPELAYEKYRARGQNIVQKTSRRTTVVQAHIQVLSVAEDRKSRPGRFVAELSFFLPSGCYATMCVEQFLRTVDDSERHSQL